MSMIKLVGLRVFILVAAFILAMAIDVACPNLVNSINAQGNHWILRTKIEATLNEQRAGWFKIGPRTVIYTEDKDLKNWLAARVDARTWEIVFREATDE